MWVARHLLKQATIFRPYTWWSIRVFSSDRRLRLQTRTYEPLENTMPRQLPLVAVVAISLLSTITSAQQPAQSKPSSAASEQKKDQKKEPPSKPVVTQHSIRLGNKALNYTATVGLMPIRNAQDEIEAHIFYMAYTLDAPPEGRHRPLMFSFNGGPGSSSVWLHLGALGPRRVQMLPDGGMPPPPADLVDNEYTWLDGVDVVFIDPVGTGYSRPVKPELGKKFWSVQGDIDSVGEFIRGYLTQYERWASPLFLVGESYGTTRASGLAGYLVDHGIALRGIVLVSAVLNFETLGFSRGNDLPYVLFLPSYAATAWYHKKLPPSHQLDLQKTLREVEQWAVTHYAVALAKGDRLTRSERQDVIDHLAQYTGLSKTYIEQSNLRVDEPHFAKELLRSEGWTVGRYDSRFKGMDETAVSSVPDYDPSEAVVRPAFTAAFNNYVRSELKYKSDAEYRILRGIRDWNWGNASQGFPNVSDALRRGFVKNPYMRVFVASGYYDLATPYFGTHYTIDHLNLDPSLRANVTTAEYEAGHMMYIRNQSLVKLKRDVSAFLEEALRARGQAGIDAHR
jgi:carboxypeptidase C (cathepsin A)